MRAQTNTYTREKTSVPQTLKSAQALPLTLANIFLFQTHSQRLSHVTGLHHLSHYQPPAPLYQCCKSTSASRCYRSMFSAPLGLIKCLKSLDTARWRAGQARVHTYTNSHPRTAYKSIHRIFIFMKNYLKSCFFCK